MKKVYFVIFSCFLLSFACQVQNIYSKPSDFRLVGVEKRAPGVYTLVQEDTSDENNHAENSSAKSIANSKSSYVHLDKIVAIVNRDVITQSELNKEMERAKKQLEQTRQPIPAQPDLKKMVLDNLIGKNLQLQLCRTRDIKVNAQDIENRIQRICKTNKITVEQLKQFLQQANISWEDYQAQLHEQIMLQKLEEDEVAKTVMLAPEDVKKFMQENESKFSQYSAFHVADLMLPLKEPPLSSEIKSNEKQAIAIVSKLQTGKDIETIMKQYPSLVQNDLGWRTLGELPSLFQAKVATMKINHVSAPIHAPNGCHILKLLDAKGQTVRPTEDEIKNMVFQQKMAVAIKEWVQKLRNDSYVRVIN
jgi:peptidyl-prolyl cis-trans isomerase SurA